MTRAGRTDLRAVDLKLGGVQIDRRVLAWVAAQRAIQTTAHAGERSLDRLDVTAPKTPGELASRRRRRHPQRGAYPAARTIGTQLLDVVKALAADQLGLGERDNQLATADTALTRLDRRRTTLTRKLAVDQPDQPQAPRERTDDRQARVRRQLLIISPELDPSDRFDTVTAVHLQGELRSSVVASIATTTIPDRPDRKPRKRGAFCS